MEACQVDGSEKSHILWPIKYCTKGGANLFLLSCKLFQWSKILNSCKGNIVVQSISGNIMLDC